MSSELPYKVKEKLARNKPECTDGSVPWQLLELNINYTHLLSVLQRTPLNILLHALTRIFFFEAQ